MLSRFMNEETVGVAARKTLAKSLQGPLACEVSRHPVVGDLVSAEFHHDEDVTGHGNGP